MSGVKELPFADLVRARMKERGIGLRSLCRSVGVDPSYFSKVLAHKRNPPAEEEVLLKMAAELDIPATRLIVSAGRIPQEWHRLWSEPGLLRRISGMLAGASAAPPALKPAAPFADNAPGTAGAENGKPAAAPRARSWRRTPKTTYIPKELGEELL
ncbi:MAG: helix-turn-helix transcriptional regulator [Elusimicrobiota bacterium]